MFKYFVKCSKNFFRFLVTVSVCLSVSESASVCLSVFDYLFVCLFVSLTRSIILVQCWKRLRTSVRDVVDVDDVH